MRRYKTTVNKYYCPQCGYKTLISEMAWQGPANNRGYYQRWGCSHNKASVQLKRCIDNGWVYADADRSKEQVLKIMTLKLTNEPPCCCIIEVLGRHAEISDYGTVLDKLARFENEFNNWLLSTNHTIHKRGFEIIHQTDFMVVVRLRDREGVGAWVYWEADREVNNILGRKDLEHPAANYIKFRDTPLSTIFNGNRYCLWKKDPDNHYPNSGALLFSGKSIGKQMRAAIIDWSSAFEKEFPKLLAEAKAQRERWTKEEVDLKDQIQRISHKIKIRQYDGETPSCYVKLERPVTPAQARKIARILEGRPEGGQA